MGRTHPLEKLIVKVAPTCAHAYEFTKTPSHRTTRISRSRVSLSLHWIILGIQDVLSTRSVPNRQSKPCFGVVFSDRGQSKHLSISPSPFLAIALTMSLTILSSLSLSLSPPCVNFAKKKFQDSTTQ